MLTCRNFILKGLTRSMNTKLIHKRIRLECGTEWAVAEDLKVRSASGRVQMSEIFLDIWTPDFEGITILRNAVNRWLRDAGIYARRTNLWVTRPCKYQTFCLLLYSQKWNETTARMVLVVYISVTWLITFGGGGQSRPRVLGTSVYEEVKWERGGRLVWTRP